MTTFGKKLNVCFCSTFCYHIGEHRTLDRHLFQNHVIFHDILSDATPTQEAIV